ncbi:MAG: TrkA family potassium uptake protein [Acholeplasma sp.]
MKIVIVDGRQEANYIINSFKKNKNVLKVINDDLFYSEYISKSNNIEVFHGDATKKYMFEISNIMDYDLLISLSEDDIKNYVVCSLAKKQYRVKKTICVVTDPQKVKVFEKLGIDSVVSSTYLLGESITNKSSIENVVSKLIVKNDEIILLEIKVEKESNIVDLQIKDMNFPIYGNISCIMRNDEVIIVSGDTLVLANDILYIMCKPEDEDNIIEFIKGS